METQLAKSIGAAARRARKALELTQEDAAERIGVSVEFYARIERGSSLPSVPTFVRIASSLGVSANTLIGGLDAQESEPPPPSWQPVAPPSSDSPEIRRLIRLLRKATPATLRLVSMLLKEMERHGQGDAPGSERAGVVLEDDAGDTEAE